MYYYKTIKYWGQQHGNEVEHSYLYPKVFRTFNEATTAGSRKLKNGKKNLLNIETNSWRSSITLPLKKIKGEKIGSKGKSMEWQIGTTHTKFWNRYLKRFSWIFRWRQKSYNQSMAYWIEFYSLKNKNMDY